MILVLPGTKWSEGLCKKIKEKGYEILLVSPEEHPYCEKYANIFLRSDIFAIDKIEEFCKGKRIDAVMSDECDIAIPVVAELSEKLGTRAISREMASLYTDKFSMREFANSINLKHPEYRLCRNLKEAIDFYDYMGGKIIIKPLDSNASHGVFVINNVQDLERLFPESMAFSRIKKAIIAEQYINGKEFTIDGIKTRTCHYTLAISEKKHYKHNPCIANELLFTYDNKEYDYDRLRRINDEFVLNSKLEYGFTHAEYKYENGEYYLIEIAARGGGNLISSIITQYLSGYDTYNYLIEASLNGAVDFDFSIDNDYKSRAAVLKFFETPGDGGVVKNIKGLDTIKEICDVKAIELNFNIGDKIEKAENDSVRIGYYVACSETYNRLKKIMNRIENELEIIVE